MNEPGRSAVHCLVQVFAGDGMTGVLRCSSVTVTLVQLSPFLRGFMGAHFEANRVLREIARLELRLVSQRDEAPGKPLATMDGRRKQAA